LRGYRRYGGVAPGANGDGPPCGYRARAREVALSFERRGISVGSSVAWASHVSATAHHSKIAHGHSLHATEHHEHASKQHAEHHG